MRLQDKYANGSQSNQHNGLAHVKHLAMCLAHPKIVSIRFAFSLISYKITVPYCAVDPYAILPFPTRQPSLLHLSSLDSSPSSTDQCSTLCLWDQLLWLTPECERCSWCLQACLVSPHAWLVSLYTLSCSIPKVAIDSILCISVVQQYSSVCVRA